jgi:hypothetical protein
MRYLIDNFHFKLIDYWKIYSDALVVIHKLIINVAKCTELVTFSKNMYKILNISLVDMNCKDQYIDAHKAGIVV